jgi:lactate dehydrogenase-like 2-hydroxyacid dehydrogenase
MIVCHSEHFSAAIVNALDSRLKIVANYSVGTDHCDLQALAARRIAVTNTPDVLFDVTADISLLLMLGAARRVVEGNRMVRTGAWNFWSPSFMVGKQVTDQRLGIVGMDRVGQAMARNALGLCMDVHYYNGNPLPAVLAQDAIYYDSIEPLLPLSDFLLLHCPATPQTRGMMMAEKFAMLPDGAVFVNVARGALVDETALMAALDSGKLSAAGLDCFVTEPGGTPSIG